MLAAVILAAGESRRMGALKQLLPWQGGTVIAAVAATVLACQGVDGPVRVVTGAARDRVEQALYPIGHRLDIIANPGYRRGMLSSVKRGVEGLPPEVEGFMLVLGDQPLVRGDTVAALARVWRSRRPLICAPAYRGRRGHPVVFSSCLVPEILALEDGDGGLRKLVQAYRSRVALVPVEDRGVVVDLDTPEDYQRHNPAVRGEER